MDKPVWLWSGFTVFAHGKSDATGVLVAFREGVKYKVRAQYVRYNGRYIVLDALIDNNPVILVNYYAPNVDTDQMKVLDEVTHIFDKTEISENTTFI